MGAAVGPGFRLASLRSLRGARVLQHQPRRSYRGVGARASWAQEVLWATSPVAEVETAAEDLYHVVLDISDNPELMNGHTKAGQFVQVCLLHASSAARLSVGSHENVLVY